MCLQKINNFLNRLRPSGSRQKLRSESGQVVLIILLVAAFAFILYAVILNYSQLTQSKTLVTMASNMAASYMASFIASYGESIFQTSLGGDTEVCGWTGIIGAIITFILVVVAVVLAIFTWGTSLLLIGAILVALAAAGIVMTVAAENTLTDKFNSIMSAQLGPKDLIVERGILTGVSNAVTDSRTITDTIDFDQDQQYGIGPGGVPNDTMGRFNWYYLQRLKTIKPRETDVQFFIDALRNFIFTNEPAPGPNWGFWDPYPQTHVCGEDESLNASSPNKPSMCDPCCLPAQALEPPISGVPVPVRPLCCDGGASPACGSSANCGNRPGDPFPTPHPVTGIQYKWLYEAFRDNRDNNDANFLSFREKLGADDEIFVFQKQAGSPTGAQIVDGQPLVNMFQYWDTSGYYRAPTFGNNDPERGIYQVIYKIWDGRLNLSQAKATPPPPPFYTNAYQSMGCMWCDSDPDPNFRPPYWDPMDPWPIADASCPQTPPGFPPEMQRLSLPGPYNPLSGSGCVDGKFQGYPAPEKALRPDKVASPHRWMDAGGGAGWVRQFLIGASEVCADSTTDPRKGLWKRGADKYCRTDPSGVSEGWPYSQLCTKHFGCTSVNPEDCTCSQAVIDRGGCTSGVGPGCSYAAQWPDDTMDDIVNGIKEFLTWAVELLSVPPDTLSDEFTEWYPVAAEWIENTGSCSNLTEPGKLWKWRDDIGNWRNVLQIWLAGDAGSTHGGSPTLPGTDYIGNNEADVWCYPDPANASPTGPMYMSANEEVYIENACVNPVYPLPPGCPGVNCCLPGSANGVQAPRTNIDKVVSCLDWNVNDPIPDTPWHIGAKGNYDKYTMCVDPLKCVQYWDTVCEVRTLPRSLVPTSVYDQTISASNSPGFWQKQMMYCLEGKPNDPSQPRCSTAACQPLLDNLPFFCVNPPPPPSGAGWGAPPINCVWNYDGTWCNNWGFGQGNIYYDTILNHLVTVVGNDPNLAGSCVDATPTGYLNFVGISRDAALNQVAKLQKRLEYFGGKAGAGGWKGIVGMVKDFVAVLDEAYTEIDAFLNGPAAQLVQTYCTWGNGDPPLPPQVIYAWQDHKPPKHLIGERATRPTEEQGYWHIVRVDARSPQRCAVFGPPVGGGPPPMLYPAACNAAQTLFGDTAWPKIRTYTKSWGTRRCYAMDQTRGTVKARVARFDEDKDAGVLKFPTGETIWQPKFSNPSTTLPGTLQNVNTAIELECNDLMNDYWDPVANPYFPPEARRAFIMNQEVEDSDCWFRLNQYLQRGVYTETCAQYYLKENSPATGFHMKFVPCQNFDD